MTDHRDILEPVRARAGLPPLDFPEDSPEPERVRTPVTAKRVALVGARVISGAVGIGVAVVTVAAAALLPIPTIGSMPVGVLVTPVPTAQQLVCPGAVLRLADDSGQGATTSSALGAPTVDIASGQSGATGTPAEQSDAGTGGTASAPLIVSTLPDAADPTERVLLSGAQVQQVTESEFIGLAAAACTPVAGQSWLAAGSTAVGRTTLLSLTNPTEVPATVDLTIYGENGLIAAPGTSGIVVPSNGQRVISLAGFAPDVASPVVLVTSTGGQVAASLQQSIVRGLEPGGVDIVGPTAAPSVDTVIPGVVISGSEAVQALLGGGSDYQDLRASLRLFAPGEGTVMTTISVIPEDGAGVGTSFTFELDAGRVSDVPFDELLDGSYTVRVETDQPTVAAVRVSTAAPGITDFAWMTAAPEFTTSAQVTIADRAGSVLHLAHPVDTAVTVTVGGETVTLAAGTSTLVPVDAGDTLLIEGAERLHAAVSVGEPGLIAGYPVLPPGEGSLPVRVYP